MWENEWIRAERGRPEKEERKGAREGAVLQKVREKSPRFCPGFKILGPSVFMHGLIYFGLDTLE